MSVCGGKEDYKAKHPDLFPFVALPSPYPPSSLQTNGDGQSVPRQIKDEKSISWQQDGMAQLFWAGIERRSAGRQSGRERSRRKKKAKSKKKAKKSELARTVLYLAVTRLHRGATLNDVSAVCIMVNETSPLIYQHFLMFKTFQDDEALQQNLLRTITCTHKMFGGTSFTAGVSFFFFLQEPFRDTPR